MHRDDVIARVERSAAELAEARGRLARARGDYAVVQRSKFARARSLWFLLKNLLGIHAARDRYAALSGGGDELAYLAAEPPR